MKKIVILILCTVFLTGCSKTQSDNQIDGKEITRVNITFAGDFNNDIDITDKDKIKRILEMISDKEVNNDISPDTKGWIYNLKFYAKDEDKIIYEITVLEDNIISDDKFYNCKNLTLSELDSISEINRSDYTTSGED